MAIAGCLSKPTSGEYILDGEEVDKLKLHIESKSSQSSTEMQMVLAQIEEKNFEIDMLTNEIADHKHHISELK
jgi:hypothetical protein